jgi:hypothetical protein
VVDESSDEEQVVYPSLIRDLLEAHEAHPFHDDEVDTKDELHDDGLVDTKDELLDDDGLVDTKDELHDDGLVDTKDELLDDDGFIDTKDELLDDDGLVDTTKDELPDDEVDTNELPDVVDTKLTLLDVLKTELRDDVVDTNKLPNDAVVDTYNELPTDDGVDYDQEVHTPSYCSDDVPDHGEEEAESAGSLETDIVSIWIETLSDESQTLVRVPLDYNDADQLDRMFSRVRDRGSIKSYCIVGNVFYFRMATFPQATRVCMRLAGVHFLQGEFIYQ